MNQIFNYPPADNMQFQFPGQYYNNTPFEMVDNNLGTLSYFDMDHNQMAYNDQMLLQQQQDFNMMVMNNFIMNDINQLSPTSLSPPQIPYDPLFTELNKQIENPILSMVDSFDTISQSTIDPTPSGLEYFNLTNLSPNDIVGDSSMFLSLYYDLELNLTCNPLYPLSIRQIELILAFYSNGLDEKFNVLNIEKLIILVKNPGKMPNTVLTYLYGICAMAIHFVDYVKQNPQLCPFVSTASEAKFYHSKMGNMFDLIVDEDKDITDLDFSVLSIISLLNIQN